VRERQYHCDNNELVEGSLLLYKRRGSPIAVLIVDFTRQTDYVRVNATFA
jgi:hypothetical protein